MDVSDIFYFFLLGGGEGGVRGAGRGRGGTKSFYGKSQEGGGGGVSRVGGGREGEGARGREGICGDLGGGGLNILFRAETSTKFI